MDQVNRSLLDFIDASPSSYHAAHNIRRTLAENGFKRLYEEEDWTLEAPGKYYVVRNSSSVVAFSLPAQPRCFQIMETHVDSPNFRIKMDGEEKTLGLYTRLGVEKYGGMLCATWLDRPLSVSTAICC